MVKINKYRWCTVLWKFYERKTIKKVFKTQRNISVYCLHRTTLQRYLQKFNMFVYTPYIFSALLATLPHITALALLLKKIIITDVKGRDKNNDTYLKPQNFVAPQKVKDLSFW